MSCSASSFGTLAVGTPNATLGPHRHSRTRIAVRTASRVLVETPAARVCVNAIDVTDATSLTHCVQDSAGDEGSSYFRYSFTSEAPGGTSAYFEADGVKLYISDAAIAASTRPESTPTQTSANLDANLPSPSAPDSAEDVAPFPAAVAGDQDADANVVTGEAVESSPPPADENISDVYVPPAVFAAATSAMRHCVMRTSGSDCLYAFDEYPPTNAGAPAFEVAGVKVYADAGDLRFEPTSEPKKETATEVVEASAPVPPVPEPVAPVPPAAVSSASAVMSRAGPGVGGEGAGKNGAAVFERGVGIAAWQGLEVGYEMDVVLEVPTPVVAVAETAAAEPAPVPVASGRKKAWMAEPLDSRPREGVRQMTSGAALFGNGVGMASFRAANLDVPGVEAETQPVVETPEVPERRQAGLKDARSPGGGVAGFTYAGTGSATFKRLGSVKSGAPTAPEPSVDAEKPPKDAVTVAVWAACAAILAFKLLISPA